jgi:hypothetical protein
MNAHIIFYDPNGSLLPNKKNNDFISKEINIQLTIIQRSCEVILTVYNMCTVREKTFFPYTTIIMFSRRREEVNNDQNTRLSSAS